MRTRLGYVFYACGKGGLPRHVELAGHSYRLRQVLKHDFFAATGLYEVCSRKTTNDNAEPAKIILKLARQEHFLGLPLAWLGRLLCEHEVSIIRTLTNIPQTPKLIATYGPNGFVYEYIEGCSLKQTNQLPNDFFDRLLELVRQVHQHNIAYLDMNKRGNILLGDDQKPYLIDFQISLHIADRSLFSKRLSEALRQFLQYADLYHLFKHKRRLYPQLLWPHEKVISYRLDPWIQAHRFIATPYRKLRRALLRFLRTKGVLVADQHIAQTPENETPRFAE
ncbi:MAG: hypothetical protein ACYTEL_03825 [Planctomycetota bacterium]|jgi:hypothetical protein